MNASILDWESPWAEPGYRLQDIPWLEGYSPWSRKGVGHVLVTKQQQLLLGNAEGKYFPINRESYVGTLLSDN